MNFLWKWRQLILFNAWELLKLYFHQLCYCWVSFRLLTRMLMNIGEGPGSLSLSFLNILSWANLLIIEFSNYFFFFLAHNSISERFKGYLRYLDCMLNVFLVEKEMLASLTLIAVNYCVRKFLKIVIWPYERICTFFT